MHQYHPWSMKRKYIRALVFLVFFVILKLYVFFILRQTAIPPEAINKTEGYCYSADLTSIFKMKTTLAKFLCPHPFTLSVYENGTMLKLLHPVPDEFALNGFSMTFALYEDMISKGKGRYIIWSSPACQQLLGFSSITNSDPQSNEYNLKLSYRYLLSFSTVEMLFLLFISLFLFKWQLLRAAALNFILLLAYLYLVFQLIGIVHMAAVKLDF